MAKLLRLPLKTSVDWAQAALFVEQVSHVTKGDEQGTYCTLHLASGESLAVRMPYEECCALIDASHA